MNDRARRLLPQAAAIAVGVLLILFFRGAFSDDGGSTDASGGPSPILDDCLHVAVTASSEKAALVTQIAGDFARSGAQVDGRCVVADVTSKASGGAMQALANGWDDGSTDRGPWCGRRPRRRGLSSSTNGRPIRADLVANQGTPFMNSPLVIAMPQPMAEALGWPDKALGWSDVLSLATSPTGLGGLRPSGVGRVQARQDQPELLDERALGPDRPELRRHRQDPATSRTEDLAKADVEQYNRSVESAVVHYGDTTLTFLQQLVPRRPGGHRAHLRVGGGRRREVGDRLQHRQPRRRSSTRAKSRKPSRPARRDLSEGGHALLGQPLRRSSTRPG